MVDWNVNPSPLDGAVLGMREEGTSLCADVNKKNSHFQPVCALTDHSKHYAQHRGRTTLDHSTEIHFRRDPERGDSADEHHCRFLTIECCVNIFGCCAHISVMSLHAIPKCQCHCPSCLLSCLPVHRGERKGRLCTLRQSDPQADPAHY